MSWFSKDTKTATDLIFAEKEIFTEHKVGDTTVRTVPRPTRTYPKIEDVVFPGVDTTDPWVATYFNKIVTDLKESFAGKNGRVDICPVNDAIKYFNLELDVERREIYDRLRSLHCIHFSDIHPDILAIVPSMYSCLFTEGQIPCSLNSAVVQTTPATGLQLIKGDY